MSRFPVTLLIVVVSVAGGLVLGFILAAARIFKIPVLRELAALYISASGLQKDHYPTGI
ncbi:MAG: hypothetical protein V8R61_13060 [Enterocloster sp.]